MLQEKEEKEQFQKKRGKKKEAHPDHLQPTKAHLTSQ
jgi:hypothetical protein